MPENVFICAHTVLISIIFEPNPEKKVFKRWKIERFLRYNSRVMSFSLQPLQSQWWWHMSLPPPCQPPQLPTFSLSAFFLSTLQWTALELEWTEQDRQLPGPCAPERKRGGKRRRGCTDFNEMHSVNGHSLWRGQEEKGALSFSPLPSPLCPFLQLPLSLSLSCPPPQLARGFVRRQMIPQMPRPSRPFQLHSPASPWVRGHHRASEWVSVATVVWSWRLREWQRLFVVAWLPWTVLN